MGKKKKTILYFIIILLLFIVHPAIYPSHAQESISPEDAPKHIGENQTVCGTVASTFYYFKGKGKPTFINLNKPYPGQIFTILIWGSDRDKFEAAPEKMYKDKNVCVSGEIISFKGTPEIVVKNPSQIKFKQ